MFYCHLHGRRTAMTACSAAAAIASASTCASAEGGPVFVPLAVESVHNYSWAYAVTPDGLSAFGRESEDASGQSPAMRWSLPAGTRHELGDLSGGGNGAQINAVSEGGAVAVGWGLGPSGQTAVRWTASTGFESLPDLPGGSLYGEAFAVSRSGHVMVGTSNGTEGNTAVRWIEAGGDIVAHTLGVLPNGSRAIEARGISADGSLVVGVAQVGSRFVGVRWTADLGLEQLPHGPVLSYRAQGVSGDGQVIVGVADGVATRWVGDQPGESLGDLPGGSTDSAALAASFDGSVIVGRGDDGTFGGDKAVVWFGESGPVSLQSYLVQDHGLDLSGWLLRTASAVSDDGLTIVGWGRNPQGRFQAYAVILPSPGVTSMLLMAAVPLARRRRR